MRRAKVWNGSQQFKGALAAKMAGIPIIWVIEDTLMAYVVRKICTITAKYTGPRPVNFRVYPKILFLIRNC